MPPTPTHPATHDQPLADWLLQWRTEVGSDLLQVSARHMAAEGITAAMLPDLARLGAHAASIWWGRAGAPNTATARLGLLGGGLLRLGMPPVEVFGWLRVAAGRRGADDDVQRMTRETASIRPTNAAAACPPGLSVWREPADQPTEARGWAALAWAAGLQAEEARSQHASRDLDLATLGTLASLRGYRIPLVQPSAAWTADAPTPASLMSAPRFPAGPQEQEGHSWWRRQTRKLTR